MPAIENTAIKNKSWNNSFGQMWRCHWTSCFPSKPRGVGPKSEMTLSEGCCCCSWDSPHLSPVGRLERGGRGGRSSVDIESLP